MKKSKGVFLMMAVWWLFALPAWAASEIGAGGEVLTMLSQANDFFRQATLSQDSVQARELYEKAILRYEAIASQGVENGKLYYNIANSYFRMNDLGRAILNYRRAARLMPDDENLSHNLAYALSRQQDGIELKQEEQILKTLLFWHYDLPTGIRLTMLLSFNGLFWGLALARLFIKSAALTWGLSIFLGLSLIFGGSLAYERIKGEGAQGVVVAKEVMARKGDSDSYQPSFNHPLHAGLDFSLLEARGQWLYIELRDGRKCWLPEASAELL